MFFDTLIRDQRFFYHIDESNASSLFNDFILETIMIILKKLIDFLKTNSGYVFDKEPNLQVLKYGMQGIVLSWFRSGMRENPEFLVRDIAEIDHETLMHMLGGVKMEAISNTKRNVSKN